MVTPFAGLESTLHSLGSAGAWCCGGVSVLGLGVLVYLAFFWKREPPA